MFLSIDLQISRFIFVVNSETTQIKKTVVWSNFKDGIVFILNYSQPSKIFPTTNVMAKQRFVDQPLKI